MNMAVSEIFGEGGLGAGAANIGQNILNTGMYIAIFVFVVLFGAISAYWIWRNSKFNVTCIIFSKRRDGDRIIIDKGGFLKNFRTNTYYFQLKKIKAKIQPPRFDYVGAQKVLFLRQISMDTFIPIKISDPKEIPEEVRAYLISGQKKIFIPTNYKLNEPNIDLKASESDIGHWAALSMREVRDRFKLQSKLMEYMPYISFGVMMMVFMIVVIVMLKKFDQLIPAFTAASQSMANALSSINAGGAVIPVP